MKRKKLPLWLLLVLGLCLAVICVGTTWLFAASVADPELFEEVTNPVVLFVAKQMDKVEEGVKKMGESLDKGVDNVKLYFQEKQEEKEEKKQAELQAEIAALEAADNQAYQDSLLSAPRELADPVITHFEVNEFTGLELLLGGNHQLIYFNQTDPQWGQYGTDSINGYGCGPTAMAMVVSTLTGNYITPDEMAQIFVDHSYWAKGSGTYYHFADGCGELFGLDVIPLVPEEISKGEIIQYLMGDSLIIALVSQGHFTNGGHYILLRGATLGGDVLVADPASRDRSLTTWDPQLILDELSAARYHGAPLWVFSKKPEELLIPEIE